MKTRAISLFLAILIILSLPITASASGDPNVDGGSGGMGSGNANNRWTPGHDGARVSVVNAETGATVGTPIDYTNITPAGGIYHFGQVSKLQYRNGRGLSPVRGGYSYRRPSPALPRIVSSGTQKASIAAIRRYFSSEGAAMMIARDMGVPFENLVSGRYKLLVEPIAYFRFNGVNVGMTAHEAALYDQQLGGGLRSRMVSLSHQNLPLALFLERPDLGIGAFRGSTSSRHSNDTILSYLGVGIVSYVEMPDEYVPSAIDVEYRVNTEVITAVTLHALDEICPDSPARVTFNAGGQTHTMSNVVIPAGESQRVWFKWTTPANEQDITITISTNRGYLDSNRINAKIVDLNRNPPPDPKATDRNDSYQKTAAPVNPQKTSARWVVWWAVWNPYWEWEPDWRWVPDVRWVSDMRWDSDWRWVVDSEGNGRWVDRGRWRDYGYYYDFGRWVDFGFWVDNGWYNFFTNIYTASLSASSRVSPDSKVPTAGASTIKSGYGVNNTVTAGFSTNAPNSHVTGAQTAVSYFPEFRYATYWRLLELTQRGYSSRHEFRNNQFSTYNQRAHFTPVWYPNGSYVVYTHLLDAWTPDGMLSMNLNSNVNIQGSLFDDWRVAPKN